MSRRCRELTYWQPPQEDPAPEPEPRDDALWGWTVAEIHDLAKSAALSNRWLVSDFSVRFEAAWDGITDELLAAQSRPSRHDLQAAGKGAISRGLLKDFCHTYGVADRDLTAGIASAPRFAAYWLGERGEGFEERVTDRVALGQVMAALRPADRETLEALAAGGDLAAGAALLGIRRGAFQMRVSQARKAFEARWYSPEASPKPTGPRSRYSPSAWNESRKAPCGTWGAYERHRERGDECGDPEGCRAAYTAHERDRKRKRRAA